MTTTPEDSAKQPDAKLPTAYPWFVRWYDSGPVENERIHKIGVPFVDVNADAYCTIRSGSSSELMDLGYTPFCHLEVDQFEETSPLSEAIYGICVKATDSGRRDVNLDVRVTLDGTDDPIYHIWYREVRK